LDSRLARSVPWLCGALALALYASTPLRAHFSDGVWLADRVEKGAVPYYNVLYVPLAHASYRALHALLGWDAHRSLIGFSALSTAAAVVVLARSLQRYRLAPAVRAGLALLFAATPSVWFFATVGEVHALQLLAVTAATALALRARDAPPAAAVALTSGGIVAMVAAHLTTVLLAPALIVLARGDQPGRGLRWRGPGAAAARRAALAAALVAALAWMLARWSAGRFAPGPLFAFIVQAFRGRLAEGVWFGPAEVAGFLQAELVAPAFGILLLAAGGLFLGRSRRLLVPALVALAPYVLFLPQGGIREAGAYYLSLLPLLVHVIAAAAEDLAQRGAPRPAVLGALAAALLAQLPVGVARRAEHARSGDAVEWASRAQAVAPGRCVFVVSALPRQHAIAFSGSGNKGDDYRRRFELTPASAQGALIQELLATLGRDLWSGWRVLIDSELFLGEDRPAAFLRFEERLRALPVRLVPVPPDGDPPLLLEVFLTP